MLEIVINMISSKKSVLDQNDLSIFCETLVISVCSLLTFNTDTFGSWGGIFTSQMFRPPSMSIM